MSTHVATTTPFSGDATEQAPIAIEAKTTLGQLQEFTSDPEAELARRQVERGEHVPHSAERHGQVAHRAAGEFANRHPNVHGQTTEHQPPVEADKASLAVIGHAGSSVMHLRQRHHTEAEAA